MARARFNDRRRNGPHKVQLSEWEQDMTLDHFAGWAMELFARDGKVITLDAPDGKLRLQVFLNRAWELASCQSFGKDIVAALNQMERTIDGHGGLEAMTLRLDLPDKNPREMLCVKFCRYSSAEFSSTPPGVEEEAVAPRVSISEGECMTSFQCIREDPETGLYSECWDNKGTESVTKFLDVAKSYGLKGNILMFCMGLMDTCNQ